MPVEPIHVHIPYPKLKDFIELLRKRRYDLEIYLSAAVLDQLEKDDLEQLGRHLDWNPALTLHAPFVDLNPGAVDPMVRSVTQVRFRQLMDAAAILKPRGAVFHSGYDKWRYSGRTDIWLANSRDAWCKLADAASRIGMQVAVENVFDEDPEALHLLLREVDSQDFGVCFDTGHFNLFSKATMEEWFDALGRRIVELHLHDNEGSADSHLAVGKGTVDFAKLFQFLCRHPAKPARTPVYTIEAHDKGDIETSLDRVRTLLGENSSG